mgnify:CR=1 FL=1
MVEKGHDNPDQHTRRCELIPISRRRRRAQTLDPHNEEGHGNQIEQVDSVR